jgi:hypothetical protein
MPVRRHAKDHVGYLIEDAPSKRNEDRDEDEDRSYIDRDCRNPTSGSSLEPPARHVRLDLADQRRQELNDQNPNDIRDQSSAKGPREPREQEHHSRKEDTLG